MAHQPKLTPEAAYRVLNPRLSDMRERRIGVRHKDEDCFVVMVLRYTAAGRSWECEHECPEVQSNLVAALRDQYVLHPEPIHGVPEYSFLKLGPLREVVSIRNHATQPHASGVK